MIYLLLIIIQLKLYIRWKHKPHKIYFPLHPYTSAIWDLLLYVDLFYLHWKQEAQAILIVLILLNIVLGRRLANTPAVSQVGGRYRSYGLFEEQPPVDYSILTGAWDYLYYIYSRILLFISERANNILYTGCYYNMIFFFKTRCMFKFWLVKSFKIWSKKIFLEILDNVEITAEVCAGN